MQLFTPFPSERTLTDHAGRKEVKRRTPNKPLELSPNTRPPTLAKSQVGYYHG